jgi:hypothetical protein
LIGFSKCGSTPLTEVGTDGRRRWRVVGTGSAHWSPDASTPPVHAAAGELLLLPA